MAALCQTLWKPVNGMEMAHFFGAKPVSTRGAGAAVIDMRRDRFGTL